jgi:hypothetical protein
LNLCTLCSIAEAVKNNWCFDILIFWGKSDDLMT